MAKRKRSGRPPQARHGKKSKPSRHDKRKRLKRRNPNRRRTKRAKVPLVGLIASLAAKMGALLDRRNGFRLSIILAGALLARSRRTASRWFEAAGVADDWDRFYDLLVSVGKNTSSLMIPVLSLLVQKLDPGPEGHWTIAIDDSPTKRYGRHVEAANMHHNPTPGPAGGRWLFGHNWVCLALLMQHPLWGVLALPMLSKLYVRKADIANLKERHDWEFFTKHKLALQLIRKVVGCLRALGSKAGITVVVDGAFAVRPFLFPLVSEGIRVVSRLRRDAQLFDLPPEPTGKKKKGRPPIYGKNRLSLAKRAGRQDGWETVTYRCRGVDVTRRCKTFLATSKLVSGVIRVVLVEYEDGNWAPCFSTDADMSAQAILEKAADRWAIEECFHDVKEIWGAGQQQVRNVWSNIGCWHVNTWLYTMVELTCWDASAEELVDRSGRSWDNQDRRPSHADRRRKITREMLENHFLTGLPAGPKAAKFQARIADLLTLAA
jgi:hypothetical protein